MYRATEGASSANVVTSMLALARIREFTNDYAGAETDEREILRISTKLPKKFDVRTAQVLSNLGNVLRINGKFDEAEPLLREAVERAVGAQGEAYNSAQARYYFAKLLLEKGDLKNAEAEARKSVNTLNTIKMENYTLRLSSSILGLALTRMGQTREGEMWVRKALGDETNTKPKDERHIAVFQMALGECLFYQGKLADAEVQLLAAHYVLQERFSDRNAYTRQAARDLVALYERMRMPERADFFRPLVSP
jgi:ATP/maltotriose-dependent transcriptional regulator MalT